MTNYAALVREMSRQTGLPVSVIEAQVMEESGYNPNAVSPAGAEGWLQFLPSTYTQYGGKPGTEFNPSAEATVYIRFVNALKTAEHGNTRDILAAYNAGPGNLPAGYGYADTILANAGYSGNTPPRGNIQSNAPVSSKVTKKVTKKAAKRNTAKLATPQLGHPVIGQVVPGGTGMRSPVAYSPTRTTQTRTVTPGGPGMRSPVTSTVTAHQLHEQHLAHLAHTK